MVVLIPFHLYRQQAKKKNASVLAKVHGIVKCAFWKSVAVGCLVATINAEVAISVKSVLKALH